MDPYLENPALWPDVHNSLIAAIRERLSSVLAPRYYVGLECRVYRLEADALRLVGVPDISVTPLTETRPRRPTLPLADIDVVEVEVPVGEEVREWFLEAREVGTGEVVTTIELLSPANKYPGTGRREYETKRQKVFDSLTNLVEIDLLRGGEPMPVIGKLPPSDYRILISREARRPHAQVYPFNLHQPIPVFSLPLLPGDDEPPLEVNTILHDLYARAHYEMVVNYTRPPVPPLVEEDAAWAAELIKNAHSR